MTRRPSKPASPLLQLANILWLAPLLGVPFGAFFVLVSGSPWRTFLNYWVTSVAFAAGTLLAQWIATWAIDPALRQRFGDDTRLTWWIAGVHFVSALLGVGATALILDATVQHGFLGGARGVALLITYSVLFGVLFVGVAVAFRFYHKAVDRAGSERELQLARRIQRSFLLSEFPRRPRVEVHAVNVSSKEVSGDFYDVVTPNDSEILLAIADVSGKGVPAALLSSMLQASLRTQAGMVASPAAMMATINLLACQRAATAQFATFFLASVHEPSLTLRFTNAGHNFPVFLRPTAERKLLEEGGLVIGMAEDAAYEEGTLALAEGDRVVFYTDGVTEAMRADGEMFGEERLYALLDGAKGAPSAKELVERVLAGVSEFLAGVEPGDDITVMALRVLPAGERPSS